MTTVRSCVNWTIAWAGVLVAGGCGWNLPLPDILPASMEEYHELEVEQQIALLYFSESYEFKAFHLDGTISVFSSRPGVSENLDSLTGQGVHYSLDLRSYVLIERVPLDSLVGVFPSSWEER